MSANKQDGNSQKIIRVLVVDDTALMRRIIGDIVQEQQGMELVGTAFDGENALRKIELFKPDVVTMDLEMPRLDGISTLKRIMSENPLPVIFISSHTRQGSEQTMEALANGAVDFVPKPEKGLRGKDVDHFKELLPQKIMIASAAKLGRLAGGKEKGTEPSPKGVHQVDQPPSARQRGIQLPGGQDEKRRQAQQKKLTQQPSDTTLPPRLQDIVQAPSGDEKGQSGRERYNNIGQGVGNREAEVVVAIGASTGGPKSLEEVLHHLPADLPAAVLICQHMPAGFTKSLAKRLDKISPLQVKEAWEGAPLLEGTVLLAPGDYHLKVKGQEITLDSGPKVNHVRPAVDVMLKSLVSQPFSVIGVILTGMGKDGAEGVKKLKARGGRDVFLVEDPDTAVVRGMPEAVIASGCCDKILSHPELSQQVISLAQLLKESKQK